MSVEADLAKYYAERAPYYERVYDKPQRFIRSTSSAAADAGDRRAM
jgi:hypothetical protein